ncbi:Ureidoglycolate lyase [Ruegeria atlantica]|uniref:Ureidoglycolate lyase n=1 Tax=Ruegeria atlantica TaxID=81569 RepID=A0A0N7LQA6_9RHOB|nr:Ureidoglycolate lyase [Ruegeria atlantica]
MKLLRFGPKGALRDLSGVIGNLTGESLGDEALDRLRRLDTASLPLVDGQPRIGACVGQVGKFVCIGLNYADQAAESGMELPQELVIFLRQLQPLLAPTTRSKFVVARSKLIGRWNWAW